MKHLSRKHKKRTLRKTRVFRKKNRKTIVKKRMYKKRNTRKRRRFGGMYEEEDIESGIKKPYPIFINPSNIPDLKPPTPTNEPTSWKGLQRTSKKNIENYLKKGDFSRPPLTDSAEDRELLRAYAPEVFDNSDNEFKTPRSSISSVGYETPMSEEENYTNTTRKYSISSDDSLDSTLGLIGITPSQLRRDAKLKKANKEVKAAFARLEDREQNNDD